MKRLLSCAFFVSAVCGLTACSSGPNSDSTLGGGPRTQGLLEPDAPAQRNQASGQQQQAQRSAQPQQSRSQNSGPPFVRTRSGLQYQDTVSGSGSSPAPGQTVTVHYTGWLQSNGQKFDSSVDRGEPFTFTLGVGQVIKGWDEGVASMKVGGKRRLVIPSDLGYGQNGSAPQIPANATLVFDVELLGMQPLPTYRTN